MTATGLTISRFGTTSFFYNGDAVASQDVQPSIKQVVAECSTASPAKMFRGIEKVGIIDAKNARLVPDRPRPSFVGSLVSILP